MSAYLKRYCSFKNRCTITNINVSGAAGRTHDARLLYFTKIFKDLIAGDTIPDKVVNLDDEFGEIPLVTTGGCIPMFCVVIKNV